eukprot:TRINITY_DN1241_c0_g2_i15.p1 TRINITY_DN1241_c0_g2~~TRINITY_DN1241_c0_g2_i15.p1  ORF type:complete len:173 (-),score=56.05 TRINITY_DN1241_c0_g2_i15:545-1063(-)
MRLTEEQRFTDKFQYQTPFSSLAAADNLLLKVKAQIQSDDTVKVNNTRDNFNLEHSLDSELEQLKKAQSERPQRGINDLIMLIEAPHFRVFLHSLLDYFKALFALESKMLALTQKAREYGFPEPEILPKDKDRLVEMAKKVGMNYSWILVCFIYQRKPRNDCEFFEVLFLAI